MASLAVPPEVHASSLYDARADEFADRYASVTFAQVHQRLVRHLPAAPALVLDVGAGGGRDAIALGRMGHRVVAVEPAALLRARAISADPAGLVTWLDDRLPTLGTVQGLGLQFDFVLCSAVLIHLPPVLLAPSLSSLAACLAPSGRLALTVRSRDPSESGALFHDHDVSAVAAAIDAAGLEVVERWQAADALGRVRVWDGYVAVRRSDAGEPMLRRCDE